MEAHKLSIISLTTLIFLTLSSGCVSKATFQNMADQATKLDSDLSELQRRHSDLQKQQELLRQDKAGLENDKATLLKDKGDLELTQEVLRQEKAALENDTAALSRDKAAMAASNRELEAILAAREDTLSKKIAGLRQEMTSHVAECTRHLAEQNRQIGECQQQISVQSGQLQGRDLKISEQAELLTTNSATNERLNQELQQLRAEKEAVTQQMGSTYQALIDKMKSEIDNGQITISELKGRLTVNLVDAILFDSGKAEVKAEGLKVLQKVVDILKDVSGKSIRIEGHTDNVPIIGGLAQKYPSNWELAAARAVNVARFLQERGINPHTLNAVAHGEYKPVAENETEIGRAKNRRIEIILANQE